MCFVHAAYINGPNKRRSTTEFDFTFPVVTVVFRSRTQSINALSSREAEIIDSVTASRTDRLLRSMLQELEFPQKYLTPIY